MALLPPLASAVRMPATFGVDARPSFYSSHVDASGAENTAHVVLKFHGSAPDEAFQTPMVELNGSSDSQEESPLPRVRRKRVIRKYTESSSEDDESQIKPIRRKSRFKYQESDSSSEGESDYKFVEFMYGNQTRNEILLLKKGTKQKQGKQKLKLVSELLTQSKTTESVLHVGCRIQFMEAVATTPELPYGVFRGCPDCRSCQKVVATWRPDEGRRPCIEDAPVFYPTEEEFQHPLRYISSIRAKAEPHGICRVVPPHSWKPPCPLRGDTPEAQNMQFPTRVQQVHKLQVRQTTAKECASSKQTTKKRRGRVAVGRMGESATFNSSLPAHEQPEFFGFWPGEPFLLGAFEKYAQDFKDQYFRISERQTNGSEQKWEPSVENIEGEYWRIVEQATEQIEVLYGADVETGTFGSGFPKPSSGSEATTSYEKSGWNLNNIARYPGSMLSFEEGDISGVLVPWLYIGMCFSSFCWHVEDHHFYSINYMHWGAPKIWYGVPGYAADKLEAAMKKHLPDLFYEQPDLLQKLVTQLSPSFLKQEGVPVYRIVQQPGDFVITFPNAYHSGFNAGFNVAEAVNVAPVDWLPHGQAAVERYRELGRKTSVSHDKLLLGAARVAVRMWWHSQQTEKAPLARGLAGGLEPGLVCAWQAYCGEGGMLANALKARVNMEHVRRESLKSMIGATLSMKQMDSSYDATDERECEACKYDLHLSAVGCQCCPDKFACLLHGHLLCTCPWSMKTLFYRYPFEQLSLLLAAVEGRPGAVATWAKQNGLMLSLSPSIPRGLVMPSQVISGNGVLQNARTSTSSVVAETHPQMDSRTKEMAAHHINVPDRVHMVPKLEPGIAIQPFLYPPRSLAPCDQITQPGNNPVRQDPMAVPSNSQKVVLLRSGYARAAARRNALEQAGSSMSSLSRPPCGEQGSSPQPAPSASESQRLALPSPDVILLSDDEEEMISCKLNEAADSSFSAHEFQCSLPSRVPECAMDNRLGSQAYQAESKVDLGSNWCTSSSNDLSTRPAFGRPKPTSGDPSPGSVEAVSASGNIYPGATAMTVGSLFKERALNSPSSASNLLSSRPDVQKASPAPTTEVVTVVQRGANILPRVGRVREKRDVELIDVGRLVVREGWCTRHAIYPAGFKSRLYFTSVENIFKTCLYVSEIIDRGVGKRPLFQVTHATKREPYLHESIDGCWHAIQNDINETIISLRSQNSNLQLPPLLPPPSGVEMFGLAAISIIEAVESLDPLHQCQEYWISKQQTLPNRGAETAEAETRRAGLDRLKVELKEEEPPRAPHTRAPPMRFVNTTSNSRIPVNNNICSTNKAFPVRSETPTAKQGVLLPSSSSPDTYSTMQGLFQRATPTELRFLYRLFTTEARGAEWGSAFRALKEEVQKKILG